MRFLLFAIVGLLQAATFPHVQYWQFMGPQTVIAGQRSVYYMIPRYAFNFTVDPMTSIFTVTGGTYAPVNGDVFEPDSTGTLPGGMYTITAGQWPNYVVCSSSGSTFIVRQAGAGYFNPPQPCTGTQLIVSNAGTGVHTAALSSPTGQVFLDANPSGFPTSTTFEVKVPVSNLECSQIAPVSGKPYSPGMGPFCIFASVPSGATLGTSTTHFTFCGTNSSTNCTIFDFPINVIAPVGISFTPPGSFSALPGLTKWEDVMKARPCPLSQCGNPGDPGTALSGPANFCDPLASPTPGSLTPSNSVGIGYYSWFLFFANMSLYTGNSVYTSGCYAQGASNTKNYIVTNGGNMVTFSHFTETMCRAAREFNDTSYLDACKLMINNALTKYGPSGLWQQLRENSYALMDSVQLSKSGGITNPHWADIRDMVASLVLRGTETDINVREVMQGFQFGLAGAAIEQDWQLSSDSRAPYLLKRIADYEQGNYDATNHLMMNLAAPDGSPFCSNTLLWFMTDNDGNCNTHPLNFQNLQMLLAHIFHFYYAYTGNNTYRDNGDDWFSHAFDQGGLTGKEASQDYFLSFNGVCWRTGNCPPTKWYGDASVPISHVNSFIAGNGRLN